MPIIKTNKPKYLVERTSDKNPSVEVSPRVVSTGGGGGPAVSPASETNSGIVELATAAEVTTGTDAEKAVTPATLKTETTSAKNRANHTGTQSADTLTDGSTNRLFSSAEKTKLGGVATGATANDTDANLKNRANHAGTQASSTISDFTEAVQDTVAALLAGASGVSLSYNDAGNSLTISGGGAGGLDAEAVRDAMGVAMIGAGLISIVVNDAADTITITTTATANDTDANLKARANHTGTQSADTVVDGTTNKAYTATEKTKLAGVATGATANSTNAVLLARANHTGTQSADTIVDGTTNKAYTTADDDKLAGIATGATANATDAQLRDRSTHTGTQSADSLVNGTTNQVFTLTQALKLAGISTAATANASDSALRDRSTHTGTQPASSVSDLTEAVQDIVGSFLTAGSGATVDYNDATNSLVVGATGGGGAAVGSRKAKIARHQLATIKPSVGHSLGVNEWHCPTGNVTSAAIPAEGRLLGQPMRIGRDVVLTQMSVGVTTAGSAGSVVRLGILSFHPGQVVDPYTLLDAGTVDATSTGWKVKTISLPVGAGQVIIPVAVVQGNATTRPTLRMQTAGPEAQQLLGGPGSDPALMSTNGYGTWAYASQAQAALNDVYGGGSTLRSAEAAPRIFIRADVNATPSLILEPRELRIPDGVFLRGANLTVRYAHEQMWGSNWNWNWFKDQIDDAVTLGVNCIRVMGGQGAVTAGTPLATYLARWTQMADYIAAIPGMYFYPALAGNHPVSGGALISGHQDTILQTAALLDTYSNVIGYDVYNEGGNSVPGDIAALRSLMAAVRAATALPITMSRSANTVAQYKDERRGTSFIDLSDFGDLHIYTSSIIEYKQMLNWQRSQWYGRQPTIYGEFGGSASLLSTADQTARYTNVKALLEIDPLAVGAFTWAMTDNGDGSDPANNMGLFAHPLLGGAERTAMTDVFKTFPKTVPL